MRTIDADKLLGSFVESGQKNGMKHGCKLGENWLLDYNDIKVVIDDAPTIEERPKGKWEYIGQSEVTGLKVVECTNCHKRQYGSMNFCGNCGADMRGENA